MQSTALLLACVLAAEPGAELKGTVINAGGKPISEARVFIYTARPRTGTSPLCPSCYPDCTKETTTDAQGRFFIKPLDDELLFRVLAVAEGFRARLTEHVDPLEGKATIRLTPLPQDLGERQMLRGRVVDFDGKPIIGASVEPLGTKTADRRWWGRMPGVDPVAVTNEQGKFVITTKEPKLGFDLKIDGRNHARRKVPLLETGIKVHEIKLGEGAQIQGRLMDDGEPVPNAVVGLAQTDRSVRSFVGPYEIGTGEGGYFEFLHVHPNDEYYVYTTMRSTGPRGALKTRTITLGDHGSFTDLGELTLGPSYTVSGRVILTDGEPLPEGTRLTVSREGAWDHQTIELGREGTFAAEGVPREPIKFIVRVPGYRLASGKNRYQQIRPGVLAVFVDQDMHGIEVVLEPEAAGERGE